MLKLLTLDWEGTLVDFQWNLTEAVEEVHQILAANEKVPPWVGQEKDYALLYNLLQEKKDEWELEDDLYLLLDRIYDRYDLDAASRWQANPGLVETMEKLRGYRKALITNVGRKGLDKVLPKFGMQEHFGLILTRREMRLLKPSGEGMKRAMEWAGADPAETVHIGDSFSDLYAAREAGIRIGILLGGQNAPEELLKEKPDLVLNSLTELPQALGRLSS